MKMLEFYRALEDEHRGSRELIKQRLKAYLPIVLPRIKAQQPLPILDIGCGRGEWLELLAENHVSAYGMDLDDGMLAGCRERGLQVSHGDAVEHLKHLGDRSLLLISGFHVAEHLPFPVLQTLLAEARRVLAPGGLLILETPNPENLVVGTASFYIDPTHRRPLPMQLMQSLVRYSGFSPVRLLRLQELARLKEEGPSGILDVLAGVSPDYAVIAGVDGEPLPGMLEGAAPEHGLSLFDLASRYDQSLHQKEAAWQQALSMVQGQAVAAAKEAALAQTRAETTQAQVAESRTQAAGTTALMMETRARLDSLAALLEQLRAQTAEACAHAAAAEARADEARQGIEEAQAIAQQTQQRLAAVHASRSWRLTRPLRWLARQLRALSGKD